MTQEALKLALQALEANYLLVNGTETHGGLEQFLDGYYSGCFNTAPINKQTEEAITAIKEALAREQEPQIAFNAEVVGYVAPQRTWVGLTDKNKHEIELRAGITEDDDGYIVSQVFKLTEAKLKELNA